LNEGAIFSGRDRARFSAMRSAGGTPRDMIDEEREADVC
jgi:hypothetical protein